MSKRKARRIRTPEQLAGQRARQLDLPAAQVARGDFALAPVANWSEADQRHMIRSREKTTVRRLGRIERLRAAGTIERHEADACIWYAAQHAAGYDTIVCTANYSGVRGDAPGPADLFARHRAQAEARANFAFARAALPTVFLPLFEAIALDGKTIADAGAGLYEQLGRSQRAARLRAAFRLVANRLHARIAHLLPIRAD